ncbi:hypothetical protein BMETH_358_3 [methanotrophic bacterial endosymbiont of Bathymodiolus sp.]|nr:hypothetical protein BMETH_358_3 [methanotrophic bacterial endosymbiont of Bathymodiolus sp.]
MSGRRAKKPIHDGSQKNELNGYFSQDFPGAISCVILPKESAIPFIVFPLLSRQVSLPEVLVRPNQVLPLLSWQVLLPNESVLQRISGGLA